MKWCCTVNTTNRCGHNIPMDLHLEHLNRRLKTTLQNMGSNITTYAVNLAAESIDIVDHVCQVFEQENSKHKLNSDKHSSPSFERDFKLILSVLQEQGVFTVKTTRRQHSTFKNQKQLFDKVCYAELLKWIKRTTDTLVK